MKDMNNDPMIVELKNGKVYGGRLDEYHYNSGGVVALYSCKLLDKDSCKWFDHDIMIGSENEIIPDPMPDFWIDDIKDIYVLPEEFVEKLDHEDIMQIYINPHYKPLFGIECHPSINPNKKHSPECDSRLHDSLACLYKSWVFRTAADSVEIQKKWDREFRDSFAYVRRRLLQYGAKIP